MRKEKLGLNDSIPKQYIRWANNIVHGNFGESIKYKRPVMDLIKERLPNTILLGAMSLIITYIISFTLELFQVDMHIQLVIIQFKYLTISC